MAAEQVTPQISIRFSRLGALDAVQDAGNIEEKTRSFRRLHRSNPGANQQTEYATAYAATQLLGQLDAMESHGLVAIVPEDKNDTLDDHFTEKMSNSIAFAKRLEGEDPPTEYEGPQLTLPINGDVYKRSFLNDVDPRERMHVERGYDALGNKLEPVIVVSKATLDKFLESDQPEFGLV